MFDNFSKVYVSVEDLAVRIVHVDPDRPLFMFDERILIFLKSDSYYLPSVKTPKMAANPLKKTEIRRYTTEVPAFRPFFQRYGWTLCIWDLIQALQKKNKTCAISFNYNMLVILYNVKWASSKSGDPDVMLQNATSHETCPICYPS